METLGDRLKSLMESKGLRYEDVALGVGTTVSNVCFWVSDARCPNAKNIYRLCRYFEISADYLLGLDKEDITWNY